MIKETKKNFKIIEKEEKEILKFDKKDLKIKIYDEELVANIIDKKFKKKYKDILYLFNDEETSEDDVDNIVLKIDYLKRLIVEKYYRYLNKGSINKYLKMISILEEKVGYLSKRGRGR